LKGTSLAGCRDGGKAGEGFTANNANSREWGRTVLFFSIRDSRDIRG
jgi:hypothetical protein